MHQDVEHWIRTPKTMKIMDYATPKAKNHGASRTVSPDASVLVSDHSIVLRMASFGSPTNELSKDAIRNTIEWWFDGLEVTRWPSMLLYYHNYCD